MMFGKEVLDLIENGKAEELRLGLKEGHINPNLIYKGICSNWGDCESFSETILHYACRKEQLECVRALLDHGANPNALDSYGNPALRDALRSDDSLQIPALLIEYGAELTPEIKVKMEKWQVQNLEFMIKQKAKKDIQALAIIGELVVTAIQDPQKIGADQGIKKALDAAVAYIAQLQK